MEPSTSQATSPSSSQELANILRYPKVHYHVIKFPPQVSALSPHLHPVSLIIEQSSRKMSTANKYEETGYQEGSFRGRRGYQYREGNQELEAHLEIEEVNEDDSRSFNNRLKLEHHSEYLVKTT